LREGMIIDISNAIIAITTNNSNRVKPTLFFQAFVTIGSAILLINEKKINFSVDI